MLCPISLCPRNSGVEVADEKREIGRLDTAFFCSVAPFAEAFRAVSGETRIDAAMEIAVAGARRPFPLRTRLRSSNAACRARCRRHPSRARRKRGSRSSSQAGGSERKSWPGSVQGRRWGRSVYFAVLGRRCLDPRGRNVAPGAPQLTGVTPRAHRAEREINRHVACHGSRSGPIWSDDGGTWLRDWNQRTTEDASHLPLIRAAVLLSLAEPLPASPPQPTRRASFYRTRRFKRQPGVALSTFSGMIAAPAGEPRLLRRTKNGMIPTAGRRSFVHNSRCRAQLKQEQ